MYHPNWNNDVARDRGGYTRTRTGRKFFVLDPRPEEVAITDIAFSLGNVTRWGGHCELYPVAQHAVLCVRAAEMLRLPGVDLFTMLHHDDSEAYMGDMPRPIKKGLPDYRKFEGALMKVIAKSIGFQWPMTAEEHALDNSMLIAESRLLFPKTSREDFPEDPVIPIKLNGRCWSPEEARSNYLFLHNTLQSKRV